MADRLKTDPPSYMESGSYGPAANPVLAFLNRWAVENELGPTGIVEDEDYGVLGSRWMEQYQVSHGLEPDKGCGPRTRNAMLGDGFDFVQEANAAGGNMTVFFQPDETILYWGPGIEPQMDRQVAEALLERVHGEVV
jgi:hypothetical protein